MGEEEKKKKAGREGLTCGPLHPFLFADLLDDMLGDVAFMSVKTCTHKYHIIENHSGLGKGLCFRQF